MKLLIFFMVLLAHTATAQTPTQIGGFKLNSDITQYKHLLKTETTQSIRFLEALEEAEIQNVPGFRSGYIAYGTCANPGKIVRIKLKYKDASKAFYEELLEIYNKKFDKPKWLGDAFHVISIWKWSFLDNGTKVDLYLQHNLTDKSQKIGNSVKMTMVNLVKDEVDCFEKKNPDFRHSNPEKTDNDTIKWEALIPR